MGKGVLALVHGKKPCSRCAGKSTHLAQLMKDQGCVIALDRSHAKAQQIRSALLLLVEDSPPKALFRVVLCM